MASVYQASDIRLDRTVAVKVMHEGLGDDAEFAARFVREARAAAAISHPNVVAVFDQGDDNGTLFLAMEYIRGHTLRDVIRADAPLSPARALALFEPVLAALAAAHAAGLIHRDVKPENVLIAEDGRVKVADFGLAKAVSADTQHTATGGVLIGTVSYLAPELVVDGSADPRADVYGAGVMLYELLTGVKPHEGETPIQVAYKHVHDDVPPPSRLVPRLPAYVDALVARATARDRALRSADAGVMLHQARRVSQALADGVTDDPELVADLMPSASRPQVYVAAEDIDPESDDVSTGEHPASVDPDQPGPPDREPEGSEDPDTSDQAGAAALGTVAAAGALGAAAGAGALTVAAGASAPEVPAAPEPELSFAERWRESLAALGHDQPGTPDEGDVADREDLGGSEGSGAGAPDASDEGSELPAADQAPASSVVDDADPLGQDGFYDQESDALVGAAAFGAAYEAGGDDAAFGNPDVAAWWDQPPEHTTPIAAVPPGSPGPPEDLGDAVMYGPPGGGTPPPPTRPRRSRRGPMLLALALLIAVSAGLAAWWFGFARYTQAPGVIGLRQENAVTQIEDAGLVAEVTEEAYNETVGVGKVISTNPAAGTRVLGGATIELTISKGKERYDVPKLVGLGENKAQDKITNGHLTFGTSTREWSETVPKGKVVSQSPEAGKRVRPNTVVDLVISKGRKPIRVGDWTGKSAAEATKALEGKGLKVDSSATDYSPTVPEGSVISQDPQRGTLFKGDTVTLVVSLGPEIIEIPTAGVIAASVDDARQKLEDLGFKVKVRRDATYIGLDRVLRTDPGPGTQAVKGSTVTLFLV